MAHRNATHGLSRTPEYRAWKEMVRRCTNPKCAAWPNYGGRGITVCERWLDLHAFIADMGPRPGPGYEIDRIDNDGNYDPGNCRWVTVKRNARNRRSNRMLEFRGEEHPLAEWCERLGLPRDTVRKRLEAGWSVDKALTTPVRAKKRALSKAQVATIRVLHLQGNSVSKIAQAFDVCYSTVKRAISGQRRGVG